MNSESINEARTKIELSGVNHLRSGKVREVFDLGDSLLMVATDRISAFDVVLPNGIPDKGKILNQLSSFWFNHLGNITKNHLLITDDKLIAEKLGNSYDSSQLKGRSSVVLKCEPILIECVARKYIAGSLYKDYLSAGGADTDVMVHGIHFKRGLRLCEELPETIFTPATKAHTGHDENIDMNRAGEIAGVELVEKLKSITLELFESASRKCKHAGILLADTKFEFGVHERELIWMDEVLTPDSSRFWPEDSYEPGKPQPSLDKQFIRDYLETLDWDKTSPGPILPDDIVQKTRAKYLDIFERITGHSPDLSAS